MSVHHTVHLKSNGSQECPCELKVDPQPLYGPSRDYSNLPNMGLVNNVNRHRGSKDGYKWRRRSASITKMSGGSRIHTVRKRLLHCSEDLVKCEGSTKSWLLLVNDQLMEACSAQPFTEKTARLNGPQQTRSILSC